MKMPASIAATVLGVIVVTVPAAASVDDFPGQTALESDALRRWELVDDVRLVTARYHDISAAIDDGYQPFSIDGGPAPTCFDGPNGGMGVHYVRDVDARVDPTHPEALVYELTPGGRHRLVAVEYVVPEETVVDEAGTIGALPRALGQPFHLHSSLPLYILHAWIWERNPDGMFADLNPRVASCPT
jgi:hypothetical protein